MNAQHLTTDELADAAEGPLNPERAAFAESHIAPTARTAMPSQTRCARSAPRCRQCLPAMPGSGGASTERCGC